MSSITLESTETKKEENKKEKTKKQVITKPKNSIKVLNLTEWKDSCCDETFLRMKNILRLDYLTLDEITDKYSQMYKNKSKPSINRYLKDLEDKGLVQMGGREIKEDQKASEKLYTISSYIQYVDNQFTKAWHDDKTRGIELAKKVSYPLQEKFGNGFNVEKMYDLLLNYEDTKLEKSQELLQDIVNKFDNENDETALKILQNLNNLQNNEVLVFYSNLRFISWFLFDNNLDEFLKKLNESTAEEKIVIEQGSKKHKSSKDLLIEKDSDYTYMLNDFKRDPLYFTHFTNWLIMTDIRLDSVLKILQANDHPLALPEIYKKFTTAFNHLKSDFLCYETNSKEVEKLQAKFDDYIAKTKEDQVPIDLESKDAELLSESTIYRLIQDLKNAGLVVEAGLRVKENSPKDQLLYTSVAKTIIYFEASDEFWLEEETWKKASSLIQQVLEIAFDKKILDSDKFHDIFTSIQKNRLDFFTKSLLNVNRSDIVNFFFSSLNNTELNALLDALGTVSYFNANDEILQTKKDLLDLFH